MRIADKIKNARMQKGYTQEQAAENQGDKALLKKVERDVGAVKAEKKLIKFAWISIVIGTILLILGEIIEGNPFIDFMNGALPWVLLGLMFLFAILYLNKEERDRE